MPNHWVSQVKRVQTPLEALQGVSALIIGTQWPEYQELSLRDIKNTINGHLAVFDSNRFLDSLDQCSVISYFSVGVGDE
jgi:UDP-glucose 6-dehydrogenase